MSGSERVGNFVVSDTKNGIIINDKNGDWQIKFSSNMHCYAAIKHYLESNSKPEVEVLFNTMFYATSTCVTDIGLAQVILNYFNEKVNKSKENHTDDEADLKIVKENQKLKEDERKNGHDDK